MCPVVFVCGCKGFTTLFWGSLLTLTVQGLTEAVSREGRKNQREEERWREWELIVDFLASWWPEPPAWTVKSLACQPSPGQ